MDFKLHIFSDEKGLISGAFRIKRNRQRIPADHIVHRDVTFIARYSKRPPRILRRKPAWKMICQYVVLFADAKLPSVYFFAEKHLDRIGHVRDNHIIAVCVLFRPGNFYLIQKIG